MKKPLILIFAISLLIISCSNRKEILSAVFINDGIIEKTEFKFQMYSDSTYKFTIHQYQEYQHEKNEVFRGRSFNDGDSLVFYPFNFEYLRSPKAIVKNGYLEFLEADYPFKMKVIKSRFNQKLYIDTIRFKDYALFTYDSSFHKMFRSDCSHYDLKTSDLIKVDSVINSCIKENRESIKKPITQYIKQCVAVKDSGNEVIVWVNLICGRKESWTNYYYNIIKVHDGGDCFFNLKINLNTLKYFDLIINGLAENRPAANKQYRSWLAFVAT
jgi:hypothetical protein